MYILCSMDVQRPVKATTNSTKVVKKAANATQPTKKPKRVEERGEMLMMGNCKSLTKCNSKMYRRPL